ncbi:MAG: NTP transferase domain-containing protein [Candidatus Latescibacter sp.]|nr:NTP transferase domain-containing protein [Candidatus Latescibacter sp.]
MEKIGRLSLLASFSCRAKKGADTSSNSCSHTQVYEYSPESGERVLLVLSGSNNANLINYLYCFAPELYAALCCCLDRGNLFLDLDGMEAATADGEDDNPDTRALLEGLAAVALFPKREVNLEAAQGMVSVILCGGKGSRMRSKELHKVCFPIAGRPAVNRLLDQLETAGVHEHVVVVGEKGLQIVREIAEIRDNAAFVYQINENGTGNAAKQAAYLLQSQGYKGNVLVVLGDKVLEETATERMLHIFRESGADVAVMVADKRFWPDGGRMVYDRMGRPVDIVEKRDVQKILLSERFLNLAGEMERIPACRLLEEILAVLPSDSKARPMFPELMERLDSGEDLDRSELDALIPKTSRKYVYEANGRQIEMSGEELERMCNTINQAVYLFTSEAFYRRIFSLGTDNAQKEEYLTDVIRLLARDSERHWKIIPVPVRDKNEVLSFNNPEELLHIEEYYNTKEANLTFREQAYARIDEELRKRALRPVTEWVRILEEFGPEVRAVFGKIYGVNTDLHRERREVYLKTLRKFIRVYGAHHPVIISRSPGRINLMGRHVDHRGGYTNYMAINCEVVLAAGVRNDDVIEIHNVDSRNFRPRNFSIGSELSRLPWDEWLNMINSEKVLEMIRSSSGDWSNYFRAAALRLQEKFKGRLLFGFNGVLSGNIPLAAGLSSSSAVVVTAAEALTFINGLAIAPSDFVDLCGEGEWFLGTRGGSGDHTALKFAEKGSIIHMGFHPVRIESVAPFPEGYALFILQSHQSPRKPENAMQIYNEKVAAYEAAQALVKSRYPLFQERIVHFRDINSEHLGLKPHEIYDILIDLPERITRSDLMTAIQGEDRERLEKVFTSHHEPEGGYEVRRVALFGLAEIRRARLIPELLQAGNMEGTGRLMNFSHDGDRVSRMNGLERVNYDNSCPDEYIASLKNRLAACDPTAELHLQPGGYGCSTPLIDEMVDTALSIPGVIGAQLSGAGLGGCIMALVKEESAESFRKIMIDAFYRKYNLPHSVEKCFPIEGSGVVAL